MSVPTKFFLFKRGNGIYYVGYLQAGKKHWKSTACKHKTDASRAISNLSELLRERPTPIVLAEFTKKLLGYLSATHARTSVTLFRLALTHLLQLTGDCTLSSLTFRHVDEYKGVRLHSVGPHSVNRELRTLRAAFNMAVRWQYIERNPFGGVKMIRVPEVTPCYFSKADLAKLLDVVEEVWLKELFVFAVSTGMRQGETLNLRWQDVDLKRRLIHVQSSSTFRTKGGKRRTIPMNDFVHALITSKAGKALGEHVFMRKGKRIGESHLTHLFKHYVRLAGLPEKLHWHSLRHTHASYLVQAGVPILAVSKLLGHSSVSITERHYAALAPESLHEEVNRIQISLN